MDAEMRKEMERGNGKKKGKRGSVRNGSRLDGFGGGRTKGSADWSNANCDLIHAVIVDITALGGAVTFGLSRDSGAHSLTLLLDDSRASMWYNGDADLNEKLNEVLVRIGEISSEK